MVDVSDPLVVEYCNRVVRPMAERLRNLDHFNEDAKDTYASQIQAIIAGNGDGDKILDDRGEEGVSTLTVKDVKDFMSKVDLINGFFDNPGTRDIVRKPVVRPLMTVS